jgi:hypothetical protein
MTPPDPMIVKTLEFSAVTLREHAAKRTSECSGIKGLLQ